MPVNFGPLPEGFKVIDISSEIKPKPFWMLVLPAGTDCTGLAGMEREIAQSLGVKADFIMGSGCYDIEKDAVNVAVEMMMRRSDLVVAVRCSEPAIIQEATIRSRPP